MCASISAMSEIDIYTTNPILVDSDEHVIPNFLGGRLKHRGLLDKSTNELLGQQVDAVLYDALSSFVVVTDGRSSRAPNMPPPSLRNVPANDGKSYRVHAQGIVELPSIIEIRGTSASLSVSGSIPNRRVLKKALTNWVQRNKGPTELIDRVLSNVTDVTIPSPQLTFDVNLLDTECYRAVAKMACNLFAASVPHAFLDSAFDGMRRWILGKNREVEPPVQLTHCPSVSSQFGELDHWVRVVASDGVVVGTVVLFGGFAFSIDLGRVSGLADCAFSYRIDQHGRRDRRNHADDIVACSEPHELARARSSDHFLALFKTQLELVVSNVMARQRILWIERAIEESFLAMGIRPGECLAGDDEVYAFATELSRRLMDALSTNIAMRDRADSQTLDAAPDSESES